MMGNFFFKTTYILIYFVHLFCLDKNSDNSNPNSNRSSNSEAKSLTKSCCQDMQKILSNKKLLFFPSGHLVSGTFGLKNN